MKPLAFTIAMLVGIATVLSGTLGAGSDGTAVGVDPDALARVGGAPDRVLQLGADLTMGETVVTGASGQVQILFNDDTRLVVGPNSALLIESYLLAGDDTVSEFAINALGGTFRFITGRSPKPAYSIRTPTAAIAVRGTEFDLLVDRSGTKVMLYDGALEICAPGGDCAELTERCQVGTTSAQEATLYVRSDPERLPLSLQFPYARFQHPLLADFRIDQTVKCTEVQEDIGVPAVGGSGVGPGGGGRVVIIR